MAVIDTLLERKLETLTLPLAVVLPDGHRIGPARAAITMRLKQLAPLAHIAAGEVARSRRTTSKTSSISTAACAT